MPSPVNLKNRFPTVPCAKQTIGEPHTTLLLVNLGTPQAPTAKALRPYLRQFLGDSRVIELPRAIWLPLLYGIIVPFRAPKSAHAYAKIWDESHHASPLRVITEQQTIAMQEALGPAVMVRHAMRYGEPSIPAVLSQLAASGCTRIVVMPLYPQYSAATTGSVGDEVARWLIKQRFQPALRIAEPYYSHPSYIQALATQIKAEAKRLKSTQILLASFHGLPVSYCRKGDPYECHCHTTARLLAETLNVPFCKTLEEAKAAQGKTALPPLLLTFQSRFGKAKWLQPYTAEILAKLPAAGITSAAVITPGFAADCVETLEEIAIQGKQIFMQAGGKHFHIIPCLNASKPGRKFLQILTEENLYGWR